MYKNIELSANFLPLSLSAYWNVKQNTIKNLLRFKLKLNRTFIFFFC